MEQLRVIVIVLVIVGILVCINKATQGSSSRNKSAARRHTSNSRSYSTKNSRVVTNQNFAEKLRTLNDVDDVRVQASPQQQRMISEARNYHARKKRVYATVSSKEPIGIDLSWSENLAELLEATEVVYTNAEMNCNRRLVSERFNYYRNLHYRSFTAADLCHAKREEIWSHLSSLRKIIARLNDRSDSLRVDRSTYDQLIALRTTMYDLVDYLGKRRDMLNMQTATIRDKIRNECGERGQRWYNELMQRAGK
ncbi:hypothetical protein [Stomatobaculum longum]|uniref:hypothetical protein n=1 Tax=Stomatobaculum longum TaxID=796942 RepID=UPI0028EDE8CF|nr:hypothetical protein [Stomatobaculum longum]